MDPPKEVPKKKAKEEDVKEEREVSPTSSPGSSRIGRQGHGKGKGYGGKRDERELLSRGSTGSELDIQGFHKHVVNFDAGAAVSTVPRKDFEKYVCGEPQVQNGLR